MRRSIRYVSFALFIVLIAPLLIACGEDAASPNPTPIMPPAPPSVLATPIASPVVTTPAPPQALAPDELLRYRPNELGGIPIFMYHNIVTDPTLEGHLYRTTDELRADLQWLFENDFYLVGMNSIVYGRFDVPAGKHPVVLTFDDSSSMHFSFVMGPDGQPKRDANGDFVIDPDCAVGIIEAFAAEHPDFGRTAHFGTIPVFKFSWPEYEQDEWYEAKVTWLVENGYEIGNHTSKHEDLNQATTEDFARSIAQPYIQISQFIDPNSPGFAMGVLTLPYGAYEEGGWSGDKSAYLNTGYVWDGYEIQVQAAMLVCCGPAPSPFDMEYSRLWIPRIRGDDPDFARLQEDMEKDWVLLFTSDGNPDTVTVPWPLPEHQWGKLNRDAIAGHGLTLVKYNPETGQIYTALGPQDRQTYNYQVRVRRLA